MNTFSFIMKIAIPVMQEQLAESFKDFRQFALIDMVNNEIKQRQLLVPPLMEPWILVHWFQEHDVDVVIAANMSEMAVSLFQKAGIKVVTGVPSLAFEEVAQKFLAGTLVTS